MRSTDIAIREAAATFRDIELDHPLRLAGATVDRFTLAIVKVTAEDRAGRLACGQGASVLSVPWSWPVSRLSWAARDLAMRALTERLAATALTTGPGDPFAICAELAAGLTPKGDGAQDGGDGEPMPALAAALALGAVDNAVHDGWARAARRPATSLYEGFALGRPRHLLPVQHVVGVGDPLESPGRRARPEPSARGTEGRDHGGTAGPVRPLRAWLRAEGITHVKVKLTGQDPVTDARRVADVHRVLRRSPGGHHTISLDPNEGYAETSAVVELLDILRASPAWEALTYLEQPLPRDAPPDPDGMRRIADRLPVLADESLAAERDLPRLTEEGWSGLVVKAARGQSLAMRSLAHARDHGLRVTVQDLTAVDVALAHSARLAAALPLDWPAFEYNSRQYAPRANDGLPGHLVQVRQGHIVPGPARPGIL
ncbi:enolase C-terminal domain-like protein [Nonomuraea dietziae]|uniref:enolase C-terminal domain-like protein n=1 Tax=Nonomuraea dietziae TaxID=65515 RepID=UPI0033EFC79C